MFTGAGFSLEREDAKVSRTYLASSSAINFFKPSAVVLRSNLASGNTLLSP